MPPVLPRSEEKLQFAALRKESVQVRGAQSPACPVVVQLALVASVFTRIFDLLRTITNAIFYHLSFNCQAKSFSSSVWVSRNRGVRKGNRP